MLGDGTSWGWGENSEGELGDGSQADQLLPVQTCALGTTPGACESTLQNVVSVATAPYHSLALLADGTVVGFGWNPYGEIGHSPNVDSLVPVQVVGPDGSGALSNVVQISTAIYSPAALDAAGNLWTWGDNNQAQLGNGNYGDNRGHPRAGLRALGVGSLRKLPQRSYRGGRRPIRNATPHERWHGVALSQYWTAFTLLDDGSVWGWGYNAENQLGAITADDCGGDVCSLRAVQVPGLTLF